MLRLALSVLLAALIAMDTLSVLSAAELYRWIEQDGSITFSRQKPAPGTAYQTIDTDSRTNGISGARPAAPAAAASTTRPQGAPGVAPPSASRSELAHLQKQQRCEALKKRVYSLERRLKTDLTAAEMDDTVLYMARYQQSYDRHCRG